MGRRAKPAGVKAAQGNPGKRALAPAAPAASTPGNEIPTLDSRAPKQLKSHEARAIWARLSEDLKHVNFLRATDKDAFTRYCSTLAQYWAVTLKMVKRKLVYESQSNHGKLLRIDPYFSVQERLERRLLALEDRFGMNPAARQQLLLRMSGQLPPPPPGELFPGDPNAVRPEGEETPDAPLSSPIGVLNRNNLH